MSLENIAAGLFNFNATEGLARGTSMGAQMMEVALRDQQMKLDAAQAHANAALSADRNALARRSQMFNELTDSLNRFEAKAKERQAAEWSSSLRSPQEVSAGGGYSSGAVDYSGLPSSSPAVPSPEETPREFGYTEAGGFNSMPSPSDSPVGQPQPWEGGITTGMFGDPQTSQPIGSSVTFDGRQTVQPIGGSVGDEGFLSAPSDEAGPVSFSTAPASGPGIGRIEGSASARIRDRERGRNRDPRESTRPRNNPRMASGGPSFVPEVGGGLPIARPVESDVSHLPTYLETDASSKVSPQQLYGFMAGQFANSRLNGFVPQDGARYGITTGSPEEWARFATGLAEIESGFRTTAVGDVGRFPGNSNGLYQLSPNDAQNYGLRDSPFIMAELQDGTSNAKTAVSIMEKLVTEDGVIAGRKGGGGWAGMSRYWGPLRRGVNPLNAGSVKGLNPLSGGSQEGSGGIDAGLFPPSAQPQQPQPEEQDFSHIPEYRAAQDSRTAYQDNLGKRAEIAEKMDEIRESMLKVRHEILTRDAEATARGLKPSSTGYKIAINPLKAELARLEARLRPMEEERRSLLRNEPLLKKAASDAEDAWKIVRDRQQAFSRTVPDAGTDYDPEVVMPRYAEADYVGKAALRARFAGNKEVNAGFDSIDRYREDAAKSAAAQTPAEERTVKIGSSQYTIPQLAEFYEPTTPENPESNNPVTKAVEADPLLRQAVLRYINSQPLSSDPSSGGAVGVRSLIDSELGFD